MRVYHYNHTERTLLKDLAGDAGLASDAPSVFKDDRRYWYRFRNLMNYREGCSLIYWQ